MSLYPYVVVYFTRLTQNSGRFHFSLAGKGIDLGSKSASASYYRFLKLEKHSEVVFTDLHPKDESVLRINLEQTFPLDDACIDFAILANVLEHLYDFENCVKETCRILKPGGVFIGVVPFFVRIHPDPDDFFRYTSSSLKKVFKQSGFEKVDVISLGYGPNTVAASMIAPLFRFKALMFLLYVGAIKVDKLLNKFFPDNRCVNAEYYPLSYIFVCKKGNNL